MLAFLFAAALAVARIHASQVTMDAKIRDDSDLSQVKYLAVHRLSPDSADATSRIYATTMRVLEPSRRNDRARESYV